MRTDKAFEEIRAETGSPLPVRVPFGLFGIFINLTFAIWGWEKWPAVRIVAVAATGVPAWTMAMITTLRFLARKGIFFQLKRPVLYQRLGWWLLIWPTPDEPSWRKNFAIAVLASAVVFFTIGAIRWGFFPPNTV